MIGVRDEAFLRGFVPQQSLFTSSGTSLPSSASTSTSSYFAPVPTDHFVELHSNSTLIGPNGASSSSSSNNGFVKHLPTRTLSSDPPGLLTILPEVTSGVEFFTRTSIMLDEQIVVGNNAGGIAVPISSTYSSDTAAGTAVAYSIDHRNMSVVRPVKPLQPFNSISAEFEVDHQAFQSAAAATLGVGPEDFNWDLIM